MSGTPLVITGAPRSGTTLLYNLLDGHSQISWLVTEAYFFEYLYDAGLENENVIRMLASQSLPSLMDGLRDRQVIPALDNNYRQIFAGTMETAETYEIPWSQAAFEQALRGIDFGTIGSLWRGLSFACLSAMGQEERQYVCVKSPDYGKSAVGSLTCIPDARSIVILRDPIRAIDSLKYSRDKRGVKRLTWPTLSIVIGNYRRMFRDIEAHGSERLKIIRYEDLVVDTEPIMRGLAHWLGFEYEQALIEPSFLGKSWTGHSTQRKTRGIEPDLATRPVQCLTECEQAAIIAALADPMRKFGYLP